MGKRLPNHLDGIAFWILYTQISIQLEMRRMGRSMRSNPGECEQYGNRKVITTSIEQNIFVEWRAEILFVRARTRNVKYLL